MYLNYPNMISLFRLLVAPVFFYLLVWGGANNIELVCFLYFLASISDFFDGWIARKYKKVSNVGKFFDPLADKVLTTFAFIGFVLLGIIELWMVLIIIFRDFGTTFLRVYSDRKNILMVTSLTAKWKTSLQMIFIAVILFLILLRESSWFIIRNFISDKNLLNEIIFSSFTYYLMLAITLMSLWTLVEYLKAFKQQTSKKY